MNKFRTKLYCFQVFFSGTLSGKELRYAMAQTIFQHLPMPDFLKKPLRDFGKRILKGTPSQDSQDYQEWIRCYDTLTEKDRKEINEHIHRFVNPPVFSIIMPVYNTPVHVLACAIQSVQKQLYPHWELCIADDHSTDPQVHKLLKEYAEKDPRIKVAYRQKNGHISAASNSALELATGNYIALVDHDDELTEHALYWAAAEIIAYPDAMLIYSDEDKIDINGVRSTSFFKPDWNPDLLLGQNYISHLGVYERKRVIDIGGFREGYEGSQDWDLVLRFTEGLPASAIRHIPAVLYHWRILPNSTSSGVDAKPYSMSASRRAVSEALQRRYKDTEFNLEDADRKILGHYLPRFTVKNSPFVSIIIPTRNGLDFLRPCINSLAQTEYQNYEIAIIDNQSDDPATLEYLSNISKNSNIRVLSYDDPFNYAAMHNWAIPKIRGEFLCLLNNDTQVISPQWLGDMLALAQRPGVGVVGAKLLYSDNTVQHNGVILGLLGIAGHVSKGMPSNYSYYGRGILLQNISAVTAACCLVRKSLWEEIGGMVSELGVGFNDVDFCLRLLDKGLFNVWAPQALLYHHESKSRGREKGRKKLLRFSLECAYMQWRWGRRLQFDPAYNPNFSLQTSFTLANPPRRTFPWKQEPNMISVPYGNPWSKIQFITLEPEREMKGSFLLPKELNGHLVGMSVFCKIQGGKYGGKVYLTVKDEHGNVAQAQITMTQEIKYNRFMPMWFSSPIPLFDQERLHFQFSRENSTLPLKLGANHLNQKWGHGIKDHEEMALRMILYVQKEDQCTDAVR